MVASPMSTPQIDPIRAPWSLHAPETTALTPAAATTSSRPPASSSAQANADLVPLEDIPELTLDPLQTEEDQEEGLKLLADTVSGMRTPATVSVMSHPSCIVPLSAFISLIYYSRYNIPGHFKLTACLTYGSVFVYIFVIWCLSRPYKTFSKDINRDWLDAEGPNRDIMIGARHTKNKKLAGVVVLRLSPKLVPTSGRRRGHSLSFKGGRGHIRAWAVRRKARGRGVGKELLQAAVRLARDRCGKDTDVDFLADHAHSKLIFHNMFNGFFEKVDEAAKKALRSVVDERSMTRKKKR